MNTEQEMQIKQAIEQAKNNHGQATKVKVRKIIMKSMPENISEWDKKQEVDGIIHQAHKEGIIAVFSSDIINDKTGKISWRDEIKTIDDEEERKRIFKIFESIKETRN